MANFLEQPNTVAYTKNSFHSFTSGSSDSLNLEKSLKKFFKAFHLANESTPCLVTIYNFFILTIFISKTIITIKLESNDDEYRIQSLL